MLKILDKLKNILVRIMLSCSNLSFTSSCCSNININSCAHCGSEICSGNVCLLKSKPIRK